MKASGYLFGVGILGAVVMAMVVALNISEATAGELPDASCQVTANDGNVVGTYGMNFSLAQTFTAVNSGRLTTAQVQVGDSDNTGSLVMEIRAVDGTSGRPSNTVLASASIPASEIPPTDTMVSGRFSPGAEVVAGQQYALVVRTTDGRFSVRYSSGGPCSVTAHQSIDGGASFNTLNGIDLIFSTFVDWSPVAANDTYSTAQDAPLRVAAPGLLANDSDATGDALTAAKVGETAHGEIFVNAGGSFAYFPDEGYVGPDSFTYKASDGAGSSDTATVEIAVRDVTKPTVSAMSPRHASTTRDTTPTIRATVQDNTLLSKADIQLYVAGRLISATKYSYTASTGALVHNSPKLSSGKKTVKIVATDAAGNALTKSWYFTIKR